MKLNEMRKSVTMQRNKFYREEANLISKLWFLKTSKYNLKSNDSLKNNIHKSRKKKKTHTRIYI